MKKTKFLSLVLVGLLALSGCANNNAAPKATSTPDAGKTPTEMTADVVVVGAGGAGLSAALTAAQGGSEVIVVEKLSFAGGATMTAGGGTNATGSQVNVDAGVKDTPADLKKDMLANGHNMNDEATLDIYVNTVGRAFDWLIATDGTGAAVEYDLSQPGRTYSAVGRGVQVIQTLSQQFKDAGGTLLLETPGKELIVEDGKVTGIKAEGPDGEIIIHAKAVILATGGFGANANMIDKSITEKYPYAGAVGAEGDALTMAEAVNADKINMELVNLQPNSIKFDTGRAHYANPGVGAAYSTSGAFLVSDQGVRFFNEQGNSYDLVKSMDNNAHTYLVLDQASFDAFNKGMMSSNIYTQEDVDKWVAANGSTDPCMAKGETLEELAKTLNIPEGALTAATEKYNEGATKGADEFGRKDPKALSAEGPYYVVELWTRYYATLGGLHINDKMQVLNTDQAAVEGLYAAGEVVGGLEGDIYYPGSLFGWAMTSGHNAGLEVNTAIGK